MDVLSHFARSCSVRCDDGSKVYTWHGGSTDSHSFAMSGRGRQVVTVHLEHIYPFFKAKTPQVSSLDTCVWRSEVDEPW